MIARWQRFTTLLITLSTVLTLAALWSFSPVWAVVAGVLVACGHAVLLAIEFLAMACLNRRDPAPKASLGQMGLAWWKESIAALHVFAWRQPFRATSVADEVWAPPRPGRRGVVFIHGYLCNRGLWLPWAQALHAQQRPFVLLSLEPPFASIDRYALQVEQAVAEMQRVTGMAPVVVAHSMGGLVVRAWWRWAARQGLPGRVHHVVTLGTPHNGTWLGRFVNTPNARQMNWQSEWVGALLDDEPPARRARFTCFYSNCDNIVFPASTGMLPGADNRHLPGVPHLNMAQDQTVRQQVMGLIDGMDLRADQTQEIF